MGVSLRLAAVIALAAASPGLAQPRPAPPASPAPQAAQPAQIDRNGVLILVRSTLLALQHANETGNYTVLRDIGAPGFQAANTAARLAEIFANLRGQAVDLAGVAVLDPQLTVLPEVGPNGLMRMAGFFPSVPTQVTFEMLFAPVGGRWRLFGLSVGLGQAGPVAPQAGPGPQEPPQPPAPAQAAPSARPAAPSGARQAPPTTPNPGSGNGQPRP